MKCGFLGLKNSKVLAGSDGLHRLPDTMGDELIGSGLVKVQSLQALEARSAFLEYQVS